MYCTAQSSPQGQTLSLFNADENAEDNTSIWLIKKDELREVDKCDLKCSNDYISQIVPS